MRATIIIQARANSSRLPNKMMKDFYKGKGILEILIERLQIANIDNPIILATTTNKSDNLIAELGKKKGLIVYRGSEIDVLQRFINAAKINAVSKIIRICADNPFIDIGALRFMISSFEKSESDYWCYRLSFKKPSILTHFGFWGEGVSAKALEKVWNLTADSIYHEHVTNYIYSNPNEFNIVFFDINNEISKYEDFRLTIDTIIDFELSKEIYKNLIVKKIDFNAINIISFVHKNKNWKNIMQAEINKNEK